MPGAITAANRARSLGNRTREAYIVVLDREGVSQDPDFQELVFQWRPGTITFTSGGDMSTMDVGLSHEIVGGGGNGGRSFSFEAAFTADEDLTENDDSGIARPDSQGLLGVRDGISGRRAWFSPDIRVGLLWIQGLTKMERLPDGTLIPRRRLRLILPGSGLGLRGADHIEVIAQDIQGEIDAFFASGAPRTANVNLSFREHIQTGNRLLTHTMEDYLFVVRKDAPKRYWLTRAAA